MHLSWRDGLATVCVAAALGVYAAWAVGTSLPGFGRPIEIAVAVLVLGVAASVSAVVPGFGALLHGSRLYLAAASILGVVALGTGLWTILFSGGSTALAGLVGATVVLWAMSTMRHAGSYRPQEGFGHR